MTTAAAILATIKANQEELARAKARQRATCRHSWAHRNDGKISVCRICDLVRDNEE